MSSQPIKMTDNPNNVFPCEAKATELRKAIDEWVEAAEATRAYMVRIPLDSAGPMEPLKPGFFSGMQESYDQEMRARQRYVKANNVLYDCMELHGMIE